MTTIISNCSKRKRAPLDPSLRARDLRSGETVEVVAEWTGRLQAATPAKSAKLVYSGRAFAEAAWAARVVGAKLLIVSAGLGLVDEDMMVPVYGLTTVKRDPDCILDKTGGTSPKWWAALQEMSPFQTKALEHEAGPILAALPSAYLAMVAEDWCAWPDERLARLRLFTKEEPSAAFEALREAWMPYDDRLDAVSEGLEGTQGDFAQRALRHFATNVGVGGAIEADRQAVRAALDGLSARHVPVRTRLSDNEIMAIIDSDWDTVRGRSGAMMRRLRDDLSIACEQSRFKTLFGTVAVRRGQGALL